ncbi:hypothetical protein BDW62DRAFT_162647 [Aspergillus aurantiobrunneus]
MSSLDVRRLNSIPKRQIYRSMRKLLQGQVLHLFRMVVSLALLPLDTSIFFVAAAVAYFLPSFLQLETLHRQEILRDVQFRPKTVLITGLDTPHGLRVARCWYNEGHRVVGADITDTRFASGESMSRALVGYYRIPKAQYASRLLDIVLREKVDIWIPCAQDASAVDDALAKQAIEGRTGCKCVTLDTELAIQWSRSETFVQYLTKQDLPVVENYQVQSRDSIHRILHRSPTKVYHIRKTAPAVNVEGAIVLPKRTLSSTYSKVSEIQISKDNPWLMQQHARLGELLAELLIINGYVNAIAIRPASQESAWGSSPLNEGLAAAIHQVMNSFASRGGPRVTGHLILRLMVDKQLTSNSVRYDVHIAGCTQGAAAIAHLLQNTHSQSLVNGYLAILSEDGISNTSMDVFTRPKASITRIPSRLPSVYKTIKSWDVRKVLPALYPVAQRIDWAVDEAGKLLMFWKNWRFSFTDPLPWWWHTHVSWPLREVELVLHSKRIHASQM